jgi:hypothetical protein
MQGKGKAKPVALEIPPSKPAPAAAKVALATPIPTSPAPSVPAAAPMVAVPVLPPAQEAFSTEVATGDPTLAAPASAGAAMFDPNAETGTLIRTGKAKKKFRWLRFLMYVFAFGFAACIMIVAIGFTVLFLKGRAALTGGGDDADEVPNIGYVRDPKGGEEKVFQLNLSRKEWVPDIEIAPKYGTRFAWKHTTHDVWFALAVKDYGTQRPRDAEMLGITIDKLKANLEGLELAEKADGLKVNNIAMQKLKFHGQIKATDWWGECYMFFKDGIAYWLYISSPDWDRVEEFSALLTEKKLTLLSERRGWREQPPPTETFTSANLKIAITVVQDPNRTGREWKKENAKDEDETGELVLRGIYTKEKDNRKNALLRIFTLEKKESLKEASKAVREYLAKKEENDASRKLVNAGDANAADGRVEDIGDRRGQLIDLKLQIHDEAKRYFLLAVIAEPDFTYAILWDCPWESRQIWRQEFLEVLRTMRVKKGD